MTHTKRIVVAGGAGFLGSHLCERLVASGQHVVCMDNLFSADADNIAHLEGDPGFELLRHDVTEPLPELGAVDEIYVLACPASPIHYQQVPVETIRAILLGSANLLELAVAQRARVLLASSSEVYGDPEVHPQPEDYPGRLSPVGPRACYNEAKRGAEALFISYHRQHGLPIKVARVFNTYGPRMRPDDGRVISNFVLSALRSEPLVVHGDGDQTRSFCYVDDLVEGLLRLMASPPSLTGPVNLGRPEERTIRDVAALVLRLTGSSSPLIREPRPAGDPQRRCPDISLAQSALNWSPTISLEEGLRRTIRHYASEQQEPVSPSWSTGLKPSAR
jgi:UDP-glucuronate decarboxylase